MGSPAQEITDLVVAALDGLADPAPGRPGRPRLPVDAVAAARCPRLDAPQSCCNAPGGTPASRRSPSTGPTPGWCRRWTRSPGGCATGTR